MGSVQSQRGRVVYLPNREAFLTDYYFFRIPPEGAFGVSSEKIQEEVARGSVAWTSAWDGRLAIRGDHLKRVVENNRAAASESPSPAPAPEPKKPSRPPRGPLRQQQTFCAEHAAHNGPAPSSANGVFSMSATEQWHQIVESNKAKGMPPDKAVRMAVHQHPDAHKAYLAEYNADSQHRRAAAAAAQAQRVARNF